MKSKAVIVLFFLFAISAAFAKGEVAAGEFVSFESGVCQFNLRGYKLSKAIEAAIVFGISRILDTYKETFGFSYPDDFKVKVTIIGDQDKFKEYQKNQLGLIISETGYYSGKYREAVVWKGEKTSEMLTTLFHEASHLILKYHVPWCPEWVNEGLAVYFGGLDVIGRNKRILLQKNFHSWCKHWLKNGFPIELYKYVSLSHDEWVNLRKKDSNAAYSIGYSLVYFMMSRRSTEGVLKELLWAFKRHGKEANSLQTINECYPGGFEKFERMWRKWIPRAKPYRPLRALRREAEKKLQPTAQ